MPQKTTRIEKRTYFVHEAGNLHWKILVRKDSNSTLYVPVYRKGWQDGGDEPLLHIRIYTKANEADCVPALSNPPISIQSHLPAFTFIEPEKHQVLVQLMCMLSLEGRRLKITPLLEPEDV
jgi:hypothetical protein